MTNPKTFGPLATTIDDMEDAVDVAGRDALDIIVRFKDQSRPPIEAELMRSGPENGKSDFAIGKHDNLIWIRFDEVECLQIGGIFGPPPKPITSPDGLPLHNGYCWQNSGDVVQELGYCENPACVDPKANSKERTKYTLPKGKYWGASSKSTRCTCGATVHLT